MRWATLGFGVERQRLHSTRADVIKGAEVLITRRGKLLEEASRPFPAGEAAYRNRMAMRFGWLVSRGGGAENDAWLDLVRRGCRAL